MFGYRASGLCWSSNQSEDRTDRRLLPRSDEVAFDHTSVERFDFDRSLLSIDDGNDVATDYLVTGFLEPLHERACFHIGAERGHTELDHHETDAGISARTASTIA
jgi:hypothetical protein